jgi:hypothetical protein
LKNALRVCGEYQIPAQPSGLSEACDKIEAAQAFLELTMGEKVEGLPQPVVAAFEAGEVLHSALAERAELLRCAQELTIQDDDLCLLHAHPACKSDFRIHRGQSDKELCRALQICREFDKAELGEKSEFPFRTMVELLAAVSKVSITQEGDAKKGIPPSTVQEFRSKNLEEVLGVAEKVFVHEMQFIEKTGAMEAATDDNDKQLRGFALDKVQKSMEKFGAAAEKAAAEIGALAKIAGEVPADEMTDDFPNTSEVRSLCGGMIDSKSGKLTDLEACLECTMPCPICKKCIRGYAAATRNDCSQCKLCLSCSKDPSINPKDKDRQISQGCTRCKKPGECRSTVLPDDPLSGRNVPINFDLWWKLISHELSSDAQSNKSDDKKAAHFLGLNHNALLAGLDLPPLPTSPRSRSASPARS